MVFSWVASDWKPIATAFWAPALALVPSAIESAPFCTAPDPNAIPRTPFAVPPPPKTCADAGEAMLPNAIAPSAAARTLPLPSAPSPRPLRRMPSTRHALRSTAIRRRRTERLSAAPAIQFPTKPEESSILARPLTYPVMLVFPRNCRGALMCRIIRLGGQKILEITRRLPQRETYLRALFFNQLAGARYPWLRRLGNRMQGGFGPLRRQVHCHQRSAEI